jgi:hypothetical protein
MWKIKYCRAGQATDDNIIWRTRIACWITKSRIHTLKIRDIYYFYTASLVTRKKTLKLRLYVHSLSCMCCPPICVSIFLVSHTHHARICVQNKRRRFWTFLFWNIKVLAFSLHLFSTYIDDTLLVSKSQDHNLLCSVGVPFCIIGSWIRRVTDISISASVILSVNTAAWIRSWTSDGECSTGTKTMANY